LHNVVVDFFVACVLMLLLQRWLDGCISPASNDAAAAAAAAGIAAFAAADAGAVHDDNVSCVIFTILLGFAIKITKPNPYRDLICSSCTFIVWC
jgi:hypothetical protein